MPSDTIMTNIEFSIIFWISILLITILLLKIFDSFVLVKVIIIEYKITQNNQTVKIDQVIYRD